jgi:hypothetical protein
MWNIMEFTMKHGTWSWTKMEISRRSVGDIANDDLVSGFHRSFYFSMTSIFFRWVETTNQGSYTVYISNENGQNWRFWRIRTLDISTFFEHIFGWTREMTMRFSQRPPCFFRRPDHKDSNVPREGTRSHPLSLRQPSRRRPLLRKKWFVKRRKPTEFDLENPADCVKLICVHFNELLV